MKGVANQFDFERFPPGSSFIRPPRYSSLDHLRASPVAATETAGGISESDNRALRSPRRLSNVACLEEGRSRTTKSRGGFRLPCKWRKTSRTKRFALFRTTAHPSCLTATMPSRECARAFLLCCMITKRPRRRGRPAMERNSERFRMRCQGRNEYCLAIVSSHFMRPSDTGVLERTTPPYLASNRVGKTRARQTAKR